MTAVERERLAIAADLLAPRLLGMLLVRRIAGKRLAGIIVETEAYLGAVDRASHAFAGRRTARNQSMYGRPGIAYVYFTYGMHHCMNVVCGREGEASAVLLRALEPIEGLEVMRRARGPGRGGVPRADQELCSGPGKLCQALSIDRSLDGADLTTGKAGLWIEPGRGEAGVVGRSARVGVDYAGEWAATPLRFFIEGNAHVSGKGGARPGRKRAGGG